jgi:hypothetical protein
MKGYPKFIFINDIIHQLYQERAWKCLRKCMEVLDKRAISGICIIREKGGHSISACEKVRKCCMKGLPRRTRSLMYGTIDALQRR